MKYFSIFYLFIIISLALCAPFIFTYDPYDIQLSKSFFGPSWTHPFGYDENGKNLFVQMIYGSRISLTVTFTVVALSLLIGLIMGTLAAYVGSWLETMIMSLVDLVLAFPKFLMALTLVAMLGSSLFHLIFALSFSTWAGFARLVRAEVKHLKQKEFVLQAQSIGCSPIFLIYKHIWPSLFGLLAVHSIFQSAGVLIAESGLSFLGLGVSLENPSWGGILGMGRNHIFTSSHLIIFPSLVLFLFLLSLNYLGESFRDYFDPHR